MKIFTPFYSLLMMYIRMDFKHSYEPIITGHSLSSEELKEIYDFRISIYNKTHSYLVPDSDLAANTEKTFDLHSFHCRVRNKKGELVAVLRLLPYPFEMSSFNLPVGTRMSQYNNYLEISRLVTSKPGMGIGKRLLVFSGIWAIRDTLYDGFLAVCRKKNLRLFSVFGLSKISNFEISHRPGAQYSLIKADFRLITKCTFKFFSKRLNPITSLTYVFKKTLLVLNPRS